MAAFFLAPEVIWICSIFIVVNLTDYFLLLKQGYCITQYTYNIVIK